MTTFNPHTADRSQHHSSDEIDLRDIALMLINGWRWIARQHRDLSDPGGALYRGIHVDISFITQLYRDE